AESEEPVSDPRTTILHMPDLLPRGGVLRLKAKRGLVREVLTRIQGRVQRDPYEREVRELTLTDEERHGIVARTASLGFTDLPASARTHVTSGWLRRLDAIGLPDQSFRLRRI